MHASPRPHREHHVLGTLLLLALALSTAACASSDQGVARDAGPDVPTDGVRRDVASAGDAGDAGSSLVFGNCATSPDRPECQCVAGETRGCYPSQVNEPGVGVCRPGRVTCMATQEFGRFGACAGAIVPQPEVCNGMDDDCDGMTDESLGSSMCGTGACARMVDTCRDGIAQRCIPGEPSPESCDGMDNDCNGTTDERCTCTLATMRSCYGGPDGTRDVGICRAGTQTCVEGALAMATAWGACDGEVVPSTEICNGMDDDCDGITDEGCTCALNTTRTCFSGPLTHVDVGACRNGTQRCVSTDDGRTSSWDGCVGEVLATPESCNGADDDCDGMVDDGLGTQSCGTGACQRTVAACEAGVPGSCVAGTPQTETCDGIDNDCNGTVDNGCGCTLGTSQQCYSGPTGSADVGICRRGTQTCVAGAGGSGSVWGACSGEVVPQAEVCNSRDDDCDGTTDEGFGTQTCGAGGCRRTQDVCVGGTTMTCTPGPSTTEVCNGADDDCDGMTDEGLGTRTCGMGACQRTVAGCEAGLPPVCTPGPSTMEVCNGADDDCDGTTDEGLGTQTCGVGACRRTQDVCVGGTTMTCTPGPSTMEVCNGADDDCDGMTDEGLGTRTCGTGACQRTVPACEAGLAPVCTPGPSTTEVCNGADDDCDGMTDEGLGTRTCGVGACQRTVAACEAGVPGSCVAGTPQTETCDGIDNDCNGTVDNGCGCTLGTSQQCYSGPAGSADVGICRRGTQTCVAGAGGSGSVWGACSGEVVPQAEVCNSRDDDCDGTTDEGFGTQTCGTGACRRTQDVCVSGTTMTCTPGPSTTEVCNGIDDDCDGVNDEGLGTRTCGTGECQRTVAACEAGLSPVCTPGPSNPEVCNGRDDDCDGMTDEGLGTRTCGTGECQRTVPACEAGLPPVCTPGPSNPEVCNGRDDDCDGVTDEGLGTSSCGVGACSRTQEVCVGGALVTCSPNPPSPEVCNGVDDDCDGSIDEDLGVITCGVGPCQRTVPRCAGGREQTCVPGTPSAEVCDDLDNDCNGVVNDGLCPARECCRPDTGACSTCGDLCRDAINIDLTLGPEVEVGASNVNAYFDIASPCDPDQTSGDIFFRFTLTQREVVYADTQGAGPCTVLFFANNCTDPRVAAVREVTCNDYDRFLCGSEASGRSVIVSVFDPGTYYLIYRTTFGTIGSAGIRIKHLPVGNGSVGFLRRGAWTVTGATSGVSGVGGTCGGSGPEATYWWYSCALSAGGTLTANACTATFDSVLHTRSLTGPPGPSGACDDNGCGTTRSRLSAPIPAGAGLHTLTIDSNDSGGSFTDLPVTRP